MKLSYYICILAMLMLMPTAVMAQSPSQYMRDASLVSISSDNKNITLRCSGQAEKKKEALIMAEKSAMYCLLHVGIEGVNGGKPLCPENTDYDRRMFYENRYTTFLINSKDLDSYRKIGNSQRAEVEITLAYAFLQKDVAKVFGSSKINPTGLLPTITIVPFIREGENQIKVLEGTSLRRSSAASVTTMFSKKGYLTKDYLSMVRNATNNDILLSGTQSDAVTKMLQNSGADVKVEVRTSYAGSATNLASAVVEITAIEAFTSTTLASVKLTGQARGDSTLIIDQVIESRSNEQKRNLFFKELNDAFNNIVDAGLEVNVNMAISNSIDDWTFDDDLPNGKNFKEELEGWLESIAVNRNARMDINNDKYIGINIRVPFYGEDKKPYKISGFRTALRRYLKQLLGDDYTAKIVAEGQKITVTIQ